MAPRAALLLAAAAAASAGAAGADQPAWFHGKGCAASDLWYSGTYFCMESHGIGAASPAGGGGGAAGYLYDPQLLDRGNATRNWFELQWEPIFTQPAGTSDAGWTFTMTNGAFSEREADGGGEVTFTRYPSRAAADGWICAMLFTLDPFWSASCLPRDSALDAMITLQFYPNYNDIYEPQGDWCARATRSRRRRPALRPPLRMPNAARGPSFIEYLLVQYDFNGGTAEYRAPGTGGSPRASTRPRPRTCSPAAWSPRPSRRAGSSRRAGACTRRSGTPW